MTVNELKTRLTGAIGGPVSPFRSDLSLNTDALERNIAEMGRYNFSALLIAAGIGECYSLTPDEMVASARLAKVVLGRSIPVIGTVAFNAPIAVELAEALEDVGADALLVMPPYFTNAPEEGMIAYYEAIGRASGLPLIIYSRDWAVFSPHAVARMAERIPTLAAWKDGQGDTRRYQRIMLEVGDRLAWLGGAGDDSAPGYYAIGVQGYTSSLSNIVPSLSIRIAEAGSRGDFAELNQLVATYAHPLFAIRERRRGYDVAVIKCLMKLLGMNGGTVRPPLTMPGARDLEDVEALKDRYQALLREDVMEA